MPTSMHTHRVNQHRTVPDITPSHPQGRPRNGPSTCKPSAAAGSAKLSAAAGSATAAGSAGTSQNKTAGGALDENIISTLTIKGCPHLTCIDVLTSCNVLSGSVFPCDM